MGINELFYGIAKVVEQFAEELAEQSLREKMSQTVRGPKATLENSEKNPGREKFFHPVFPKTG